MNENNGYESASDLAVLWQEALTEYYKTAEVDPRTMPTYASMADIMRDRTVQRNFQTFRDKGGRIDKLRHLVASNTDLILKSAKYVADAASAAFPPSSAILTALTFVMRASQDVSKDYDKIMSFFDELNTFLERLGMLEQKLPRFEGYRSHLVRVFAAIMKLCALTTKATREGRLKRFGKTVLRGGEDTELSGAAGALETAMKRLESATGFATLAGVQDIKEGTHRLERTQKETSQMLYGISANLHSSHSEAIELYQTMSAKFDRILLAQERTMRNANPEQETQNLEPGFRKKAAWDVVSRAFPVADTAMSHGRTIEQVFVDGVGRWLFAAKQYTSWTSGEVNHGILCLTGQAGIGKSCLAYAATRELQLLTASESKVAVASIHLKDFGGDENAPKKLLCSVVNQIARGDGHYCEVVASTLEGNQDEIQWDQPGIIDRLWQQHVAAVFESTSALTLYLILDGLDECPQTEAMLSEKLQQIVRERLNIRVLVTCRPNWLSSLGGLDLSGSTIEATKEDIHEDMCSLVRAQLKSSSRLSRCQEHTRKLFLSIIPEQADTLLFAGLMSRMLEGLRQERLIAKELKRAPKGQIALFEHLVETLTKQKTQQLLNAFRTLFAWLTHCRRSLTLQEANALLQLEAHDPDVDLEEHMSGAVEVILEVIHDADHELQAWSFKAVESGADVSLSSLHVGATEMNTEALYDDAPAHVRFRDRALKEFFADSGQAKDTLRMPKTIAHIAILKYLIQLLCDQRETTQPWQRRAGDSLLNYATSSWLYHLAAIDLHSASDEQLCDVIHCLRLLFNNANNATRTMEENASVIDGDIQHLDSAEWALQIYNSAKAVLPTWIEWGLGVGKSILSQEDYLWLRQCAAQPGMIFASIAYGHFEDWLREPGELIRSYKFGVAALSLTDLLPLDEDKWLTSKCVLSVSYLLRNKLNCQAHRSIGITLRGLTYTRKALVSFNKSLNLAQSEEEKALTLAEIASTGYTIVWHRTHNPEDLNRWAPSDDEDLKEENENHKSYGYYRRIAQAAIDAIPLDERKNHLQHIRRCLITGAECERMLDNTQTAIETLNEARNLIPGEVLDADCYASLIKLVNSGFSHGSIIDLIRGWNIFEVMTWLVEDRWLGEGTSAFAKSAKQTNNEEFVVQIYEAVIQYQEPRKMAAQMQMNLAKFYMQWYRGGPGALGKAKELFYAVLGNKSNMKLATDFERWQTTNIARYEIAEVLYNQFRAISAPTIKSELLEEMRKLQEEEFNSERQKVDPYECSTAVVYACMLRKMGKMIEFQEVLNGIFRSCVNALMDADGDNDMASLCLLAKVLALVGALDRDARIAASAQYSILDQKVALTKDGTYGVLPEWRDWEEVGVELESIKSEEDVQEAEGRDGGTNAGNEKEKRYKFKSHEQWGDLAPLPAWPCEGPCEQETRHWCTVPQYLCILCTGCKICEDCFKKIQLYNEDESAREKAKDKWFCGHGHRYIKAPIEGWKGIRNGVIVIEDNGGEERILFSTWLAELQEKWKQAWDTWWRGEDAAHVLN